MSRYFLGLLVLLLCCVPAGAQTATRSIMLVWDTGVDSQMETYLHLVQQLKSRRAANHYISVSDLDHSIKVYDFNEKSHAQSLAALSLNRQQNSPYLAVVSLANGLPSKVLWGVKADDADAALSGLDKYLGLTTPPTATAHWSHNGQTWVHESGISVVPRPNYTARVENGALKLSDDQSGVNFGLYPATDMDHRQEALAVFEQNLKLRNPGLRFDGSHKLTQKNGLVRVYRYSLMSRSFKGVVILGWVGDQGKALVFSGQFPNAANLKDSSQIVTNLLKTVKIR
jgi:hypothetical protein